MPVFQNRRAIEWQIIASKPRQCWSESLSCHHVLRLHQAQQAPVRLGLESCTGCVFIASICSLPQSCTYLLHESTIIEPRGGICMGSNFVSQTGRPFATFLSASCQAPFGMCHWRCANQRVVGGGRMLQIQSIRELKICMHVSLLQENIGQY